jgi:hypothetical protein
MDGRSLWSEVFVLWRKDRKFQWKSPPSWWNLFILLPFLAMLLWSVHNSRIDLDIAKRQRVAVATVNLHDPPNHDRYGYMFLLNRSQYTGWAYPSDNITYSLGDQIVVHYDPLDPTHNLPEGFEETSGRDLIFAPFCLLVIAGLPTLIFFRRRALRMGSPSDSSSLC